jgi:hypothetical protein
MMPDAITLLFKEAYDSFPPIKGKPTDDDLLAIREAILPLLIVIPYDLLTEVHSLMTILMEAAKYEAYHGNHTFVHPFRLPLYDTTIADDATTVIHVRAEAAHKSHLVDYAAYEAAEHGVAKFLRDVIDTVWYKDLKDAKTFYIKVTVLEIMALLDANSGGLHAVDMISLCTNMHQYYVQADGIPQYIIMMEDTQKKLKRAGMPIADIELVMIALAAVLAVQDYPRKVDDWEGLASSACTWAAWKIAFCLAHIKCQCQCQASGGKPLGGAGSVLPETAPSIDRLESSLDNLALAATNNTAVLQQLTAANLALTATFTALMAINKKLVETAARGKPLGPPTGPSNPACAPNLPFPGNYCWTHGNRVSQHHMSATCSCKVLGHKDDVTAANTMGGSEKDKGWKPAAAGRKPAAAKT